MIEVIGIMRQLDINERLEIDVKILFVKHWSIVGVAQHFTYLIHKGTSYGSHVKKERKNEKKTDYGFRKITSGFSSKNN